MSSAIEPVARNACDALLLSTMDYGQDDVGPALQRLRKAAGLQQKEVARAIERSGPNVSRIEQPGSNPKLGTLLRYLAAVGANFEDLHRELREGASDPLDDAVAAVDQRIREDPAFRQLARGMLERFGGPEPPPALQALADLIDRQGDQLEQQQRQLEVYEGRLRRVEGEDDEEPAKASGG